MRGFSPTNLKYIRRFAGECLARQLVSKLLTNCRGFISYVLLTQLSSAEEREMRAERDNTTICLLLCRKQNHLVAESLCRPSASPLA